MLRGAVSNIDLLSGKYGCDSLDFAEDILGTVKKVGIDPAPVFGASS